MGKSYIIHSKDLEFIQERVGDMQKELGIDPNNNTSDHYEISPLKGKSSIGIDQMKELKAWSNSKPFRSNFKLAVILEAEKLTEQAQNSILKLLEEPNRYNSFILVTNNPKSLLATILSRCELIVDKNEYDSLFDIKKFLEMDLLDRLTFVKELSLDKDIKQRNERIESFFLALAQNYRKELRAGSNVSNRIKTLSECRELIDANVSIKNSLAYLCIKLEEKS